MADWSKQIYWDDVKEGDEVAPVEFNVTLQRLIITAGGNRDFNQVHHNDRIALAQGAPEAYANNGFVQGMWERTVREYMGLGGRVKRVGPFRMRIINTIGSHVVTKGTVKRKWQEDGENLVELEIWSEHEGGTSVGPGSVLITLPSK